jgi:hypothetical protein
VQRDLDRFLALVCRELGARESVVLEAGSPAVVEGTQLSCPTPDGRLLVARFDSAPADREAIQRRLEMLASTFDAPESDNFRPPSSRPPIAQSLEQELRVLCARAAASNAVVIDANSPVVWGAASPRGLEVLWPAADQRRDETSDAPARDEDIATRSSAAIDAVRNLSDIAASRKGRHVRHVERVGDAPYMVHSFAGIYLLLLVFDAPFDELRAERAVIDQLPRIERLVLALPPMDPSPVVGAGRGRR